MSHSLNDAGDRQSPSRLQPFFELSRMMKEGRSWSGHEKNCCFLNTGDGRFADISATSGFDFADDGRAVALSDWDGDGDIDLWISNRNAPRLRLLRNDTPGTGRFLSLRLIGNGTESNRDAVGARVEVVTAETTDKKADERLVKTLRAGEGFLSQSSKWMHFGLGEAGRVEKVVVHWPGGRTEEFAGLETSRRYRLFQGSGRPRPARDVRRGGRLTPTVPELPSQSGAARIPLVTLLRVPKLDYTAFDSTPRFLTVGGGKTVLINLWASWCAPCVAELGELAARQKELSEAGIDVVALSVDGLGDDRSDPAAAAARIADLEFPFRSGRASPRTLATLQHLHNRLTPTHVSLPLPSSFLVDTEGRLAVIYKGRLGVDELLGDRSHSSSDRLERFRRSTALPGSVIDDPRVAASYDTAETKTRFLFATDMADSRRWDDAVVQYRGVLALRPDFAEARNNLGLVYFRQGRMREAAVEYERALSDKPDFAEAHYNLGIVAEKQGDLAAAAARYEQALRLKPRYPEAHNTLGVVYARQGKIDQAAAQFEMEIRYNPEFADAHNNLGRVHLGRGALDEAKGLFQKALELKPGLVDACNNLGVVFKRLGDLDAAATQYERALEIEPTLVEARNNLGAVYLNQGKLRQAQAQFEQVLRARPDFTAARKNLDRVRALMSEQR